MTDENVVTRYSAVTAPFESAMGRLGGLASAGARAIGSVVSALNPLNLALGAGGIGLITSRVVSLNDQFESTRRTIGGTLSALGVVGGADPTTTFRNGLRAAESTMLAINAAAARLPGEAEDYVSVFQTALPDLQAAIGNNVRDIYTFTNRLTAVGRTFGLDAAQIGMDSRRLFAAGAGHAGNDVQSWARLLPFLKRVDGQANLTAESFNRMTSPQRVDLFRQSMTGLQPMLDDASSSWDSQYGALKSAGSLLLRLSGQPLFEGLKARLGSINGLIMDADGNLAPLGQRIVNIGQDVTRYFGRQVASGFSVLPAIFDMVQSKAARIMETLRAGGFLSSLARTMSNITSTAARVGQRAVAGVSGKGDAGLGITAVLTTTVAAFGRLGGVVERLSGRIDMGLAGVQHFANLLFDLGGTAIPMIIDVFSGLWETVASVTYEWLAVAGTVFAKLRPGLLALWQGISSLARGIASILFPAIRGLSHILAWLANGFATYVWPIVGKLVEWVGKVVEGLGWLLQAIGRIIAMATSAGDHATGGTAAEIRARVEARGRGGTSAPVTPPTSSQSADTGAPNAPAPETPTARGGGGRSQIDARYSRFEINQKFEEGFDPDRIALAFVRDVGRLGQERLQSGLEPTFGPV